MKDNNVNKDDPDFKQAINELKIRKKTLEDQVKQRDIFPREIHMSLVGNLDHQIDAERGEYRSIEDGGFAQTTILLRSIVFHLWWCDWSL